MYTLLTWKTGSELHQVVFRTLSLLQKTLLHKHKKKGSGASAAFVTSQRDDLGWFTVWGVHSQRYIRRKNFSQQLLCITGPSQAEPYHVLDLVGHGHKLLRFLLPVLRDELHVCHSKHPGEIGAAVALPADCRWGELEGDGAVERVAW